MKILTIKISIPNGENEDKIATAIKTNGFSNESIADQLLLIGMLENTKGIIQERIKKLAEGFKNNG